MTFPGCFQHLNGLGFFFLMQRLIKNIQFLGFFFLMQRLIKNIQFCPFLDLSSVVKKSQFYTRENESPHNALRNKLRSRKDHLKMSQCCMFCRWSRKDRIRSPIIFLREPNCLHLRNGQDVSAFFCVTLLH